MNGQDKTSSNRERKTKKPFWFKIGLFLIAGLILLLFFLSLDKNAGKLAENQVPVTPMLSHPKVPIKNPSEVAGKKLVALTFDDGPSAATTPQLLDILKNEGVQATFFVLGNSAANHPEIIEREALEGHEIASHTMDHAQLNKLTASAIKSNVEASERVIEGILGQKPAYLRPPYGAVNDTVKTAVNLPLILWSVDSLDWKNRETSAILAQIKEQVFDGAIILMHDIHPTTVAAVPEVIKLLRSENYELVTVGQMASLRGRTLETGVLYGSFR